MQSYSNIFFSNGNLDPWSSAGVAPPGPTERLPAAVIEQGGHHLDFFPSTDQDPPSVRKVRAMERKYIRRWIREAWKLQDDEAETITPESELAAVAPQAPQRPAGSG